MGGSANAPEAALARLLRSKVVPPLMIWAYLGWLCCEAASDAHRCTLTPSRIMHRTFAEAFCTVLYTLDKGWLQSQ